MEPEIISRIVDGGRWFWYVFHEGDARREVGMFPSRKEAREAADDDDRVWRALMRRVMVGR